MERHGSPEADDPYSMPRIWSARCALLRFACLSCWTTMTVAMIRKVAASEPITMTAVKIIFVSLSILRTRCNGCVQPEAPVGAKDRRRPGLTATDRALLGRSPADQGGMWVSGMQHEILTETTSFDANKVVHPEAWDAARFHWQFVLTCADRRDGRVDRESIGRPHRLLRVIAVQQCPDTRMLAGDASLVDGLSGVVDVRPRRRAVA